MSSSTRVFPALQLRKQAPDAPARLAEIEGRAVPFNTVYDAGWFREEVAPDAIKEPAALVGVALTASHGEPIGVVTAAETRADGLYVVGELIDTPAGRAWDAMVRHDPSPVTGLSIGFNINGSRREVRDGVEVEVLTDINIREIALTHMPAYQDATIDSVRHEKRDDMTETTLPPVVDTAVSDKLDALRGRIEDMETRAAKPADPRVTVIERNIPTHTTSAMDWFRRGRAGEDVAPVINTRAWAGMTTADMAPLVTGFARDLLEVVSAGRPFLQALGTTGLTAEDGMTTSFAKLAAAGGGEIDLTTLVGNQATQLSEITSVKVTVTSDGSPVRTIAGGGEISYQALERSTPSFQESYLRLLAEAWAAISEVAALTEMLLHVGIINPITYTKGDPSTWTAALRQGKRRVLRATGAPATVCIVGDALYDKIANAKDTQKRDLFPEIGPGNTSGTASPMGGLVISGVVHVNSQYIDTNQAVLTNNIAVKVKEDGPKPISADDVRHLGKDVAVYGYQAVEVRRPAGVVELSEAV